MRDAYVELVKVVCAHRDADRLDKHYQRIREVLQTDSNVAMARKWRAKAVVRDALKLLIQSRSGATLWLHVYSHIGVVGNERADALANQGQRQHPARLQMLRDLRAQQGQPRVVLS